MVTWRLPEEVAVMPRSGRIKNDVRVPGDDGVDASAERELVRAPFILNAENSAGREKGHRSAHP